MFRRLTVRQERWPLARPFRISRGVKTAADTVLVEIQQGHCKGRGESVPYARYGETVASVVAAVEMLGAAIGDGMTRQELQEAVPPGAARNAIDCAMWDLEAAVTGTPVYRVLGSEPPPSLASALTIGIDTPASMFEAARHLRAATLIKVKVDGEAADEQLRAVRAGAPRARLIVDANEAWTMAYLERMQSVMTDVGVELVEQPLPAGEDQELEGFEPAQILCADESCHVAADLPALVRRYQAVNIKLDKTGGLTEALALLQGARDAGLRIMSGCMVCTSLGIAPAFHIARHADYVDLDGPILLRHDRPGGARMDLGRLLAPDPSLWGEGGAAEQGP